MSDSTKKRGFTHDDKNNITTDWWTPGWVFDLMSCRFHMDVAAPEGGVPWIPAGKHITKEEDGLKTPWERFVWCNPPYGAETGAWIKKMSEHNNGIALVVARTDNAWFHDYCVPYASAFFFFRGRIQFVDAQGKTGGGGAGAGSMLVAFGEQGRAVLANMDGVVRSKKRGRGSEYVGFYVPNLNRFEDLIG